MAIRDWFGGKKDEKEDPAPASSSSSNSPTSSKPETTKSPNSASVPQLQTALTSLVPHHRDRAPSLDLTRARLADGLRDQHISPALPEFVAAHWQRLDDEGRRRVAVVVDAVRVVPVPFNAAGGRHGDVIVDGVFATAAGTGLLTLELLSRSPLRVEELTRWLLHHLKIPVTGETPEQSRDRLAHLDYARLLKEADTAKAAAEKRLAELQKRKEEQEKSMRGRGKW